jgi:hypothetical protein
MIINLKIEEPIYNFFSFLRFFCIYLEIHCQSCQNNPLSTDPFSTTNAYLETLLKFEIYQRTITSGLTATAESAIVRTRTTVI